MKLRKFNFESEINESSFLFEDKYKVKIITEVDKNLVVEFINKVKTETSKNPLDFFSENEIAEQMVDYIVKKYLIIDNLTSSFIVGQKQESPKEDVKEVEKEINVETKKTEKEEPVRKLKTVKDFKEANKVESGEKTDNPAEKEKAEFKKVDLE